MRIIIAGAGVGGMALAALLRKRGVKAEMYERAESLEQSGYMISLYPVGSRIFHGLGLMEDFLKASARMDAYTVYNGHGEEIHTYDIGGALAKFGYTGTILRGELLKLLRSQCEDVPLKFGTRVEGFEDKGDEVEVYLSNGTTRRCDVLVGADGIHSSIRTKLFGATPDEETGWGCWVWVMQGLKRPPGEIREYWGSGRLVGTYPVKDGWGVIGAGPADEIGPVTVGHDGRRVREYLATFGEAVEDLLPGIPDDVSKLFWWKLADHRAEEWVRGRVALMGDSACAFLPTAGVGASMALESAAVLDDELGRTDAKFAEGALAHYEQRRKKRAEAFQNDSRSLASMMTVNSLPMAWGRDQLMKLYTLDMLVKNIFKSLADPI